ncbi:helix-turn-helix domain-containing protein [Arthrobacter sp. HS15c]|uniref:AraC-like ligand-binding domain-containing protein n=1 Tax=Arthrobacter sp. HS15c TaxID=3230279 RepID=UPI003467D0DC
MALTLSSRQDVATSEAPDFDTWRQLVTQSFVPLDVTCDSKDNFQGRMRSRSMGDVSAVEVSADGHHVLRKPSLIRESDGHFFKLSIMLAGSGLLVQDNREALLLPGDIAVYDTQRPYTLTFDDKFRCLVLMFPPQLMDLPVSSVGQLTAVRMGRDERLGRVISPFLVEIARNLDQFSDATGTRLAYNAVDLVTTMFSSELDLSRSPASNPRAELMLRIRSFIEANLGDSELNLASVAAAHFISTRYLHNLFHEENESAANWIRNRRLERCRRELKDPVHSHRSISSIAAKWGFTDAAHFSRLFRAAFGETPSNYRER